MNASKPIAEESLPAFVQACIDAAKLGWKLDEWNPPMDQGRYYDCVMVRDESITDEPPMSRAETLVVARAARASRKASAASQETSEASTPGTPTSDALDAPEGAA